MIRGFRDKASSKLFHRERNRAVPSGLQTAALRKLLILDAATGGQGLDADFMVTKFTREEPLDEAIVVKVTAKPTLSTRSPTWHSGS